MGLPRFWGRLTLDEDATISPAIGDSKRSEDGAKASDGSLGIVWTIVYYALLVVGAVGWKKYLWQLTESPSYLTAF